MAELNLESLTDGARDIFLAGVGLAAIGVDKGKELIDELVKKGQLTVEQGRDLNKELTRKAKDKAGDTISDAQDRLLRMRLAAMDEDERKAYAARVAKLADDLTESDKAKKEEAGEADESDKADEAETAKD